MHLVIYLRINIYSTIVVGNMYYYMYMPYVRIQDILNMSVKKIINRYFYSDEQLKMLRPKNTIGNIQNNHKIYMYIINYMWVFLSTPQV